MAAPASTTPPALPDGLSTRLITAREADLLERYLRRDPGTDAFLLGWLEVHGVGTSGEGRFQFVGAFDGPILAGVALVVGGDICCVSHGTPQAGDALGVALAGAGADLRTLAGPTALVQPMLGHDIGCSSSPLVLDQRVYVARPADVARHRAPGLREAVASDVPALIRAGRDMHLEEIGQPISGARDALFQRGVEAKVSHGRTWVVRDAYTDELVFKASVSAACPAVGQVEGVWVAPSHRRRGVARACMSELLFQLFERHALVSLYVGLRNTPARELYRQLGFRASTPYTSVLFDAVPEG